MKDVMDFVEAFRALVELVLGDNFAGMYLLGSIALGDFDPESRGIDFLVTTHRPLPARDTDTLRRMHQEMIESGNEWAKKVEGCYVPQSDLSEFDPDALPEGSYPTTSKGKFYCAGLGSEWIFHLSILRENGIVMAGPDPKSFIKPVCSELRERF